MERGRGLGRIQWLCWRFSKLAARCPRQDVGFHIRTAIDGVTSHSILKRRLTVGIKLLARQCVFHGRL